ncbi:hypothetical protein M0R04_11565 [Candidatus Dojkabacteria bacterium]|jgi:hypothetical protein|nr:hypothetical protein [Candidatus Dojkabacteria bacterium]
MDDKHLNRLHDKLDGLDDRLNNIDKSLEKAVISLEYHIKRTDLLEDSLNKLSLDLKPLENHVTYVNNIIKFLGALGAITAFAVGIYKSFN